MTPLPSALLPAVLAVFAILPLGMAPGKTGSPKAGHAKEVTNSTSSVRPTWGFTFSMSAGTARPRPCFR
jgi:hypothetical protein